MALVNLRENGKIIGRVKRNRNLDRSPGNLGDHLGITRLKREGNPFVLIFSSDRRGEEDYAIIVDDERALQEVLKVENDALLKKYFPDHVKPLEEE